jgi:hypothetical protein
VSIEQLREEIVENSRKDRERLEQVADGLLKLTQKEREIAQDEAASELPMEAAAAVSEELSKITDSLSKINAGLIELVKIDAKSSVDPKARVEKQRDTIYDEIQRPNN